MLQTSTNITPKSRQETRYNYVRSSVFFASNCSPLLHYHYVITALTMQIPNGNAIAKSQSLFKTETDFSNFEKSLTKQLLEVALNLLRGNDLI